MRTAFGTADRLLHVAFAAQSSVEADPVKRKEMMKDIEQILQDSGIIIQPYWRKLYSHAVAGVKGYGMHPTFERDYGKVWLEEA